MVALYPHRFHSAYVTQAHNIRRHTHYPITLPFLALHLIEPIFYSKGPDPARALSFRQMEN